MGTTIGIRVRAGRGRRRAGDTIPSEYRLASYIENTSTAYIDTGVKITPSTARFVMKFSLDAWDNTKIYAMFGSRDGIGVNAANAFMYQGKIRLDWMNQTSSTYTDAVTEGTEHTIDIQLNRALLDDVEYTSSVSLEAQESSYDFYIFRVSNAPIEAVKAKCMSAQLYDNGTLIRDYVPVQRISDSAYGLWDKVNKTFNVSPNGVAFGGAIETI